MIKSIQGVTNYFIIVQTYDFRARLKLFHPSKEECQSRAGKDDNVSTDGNSSAGEDEQSRKNFERSDSLVIHDVPSKPKKNKAIQHENLASHKSSAIPIHSLIQNFRDETEKYFGTQEGIIFI